MWRSGGGACVAGGEAGRQENGGAGKWVKQPDRGLRMSWALLLYFNGA